MTIEGQSVRAVFIDFAKAFDHVDHNILVAKFVEFGLPDVIVRWMSSFLCYRRQRVKIGDIMSDWLVMNAGMPQGSNLGPLTFIMLASSMLDAQVRRRYNAHGNNRQVSYEPHASALQRGCSAGGRGSDERQWPEDQGDADRKNCQTRTVMPLDM